MKFEIKAPDEDIIPYLQDKIDNLTKPKGALGQLEEIAMQIGMIQQRLSPELNNPYHILFAGDHGIADEGVSTAPKSVTYEMVLNFLKGGAGINFLCRQHGFKLKVVDAGVDYDFEENSELISRKIRKGTRNLLNEPAMLLDEMELALVSGAEQVIKAHREGCNVISFGEMGIGNTSTSALWMHYFTGIPLEKCVGAGCDYTGGIVKHKLAVLSQARDNFNGESTPETVISHFGGFETVMTVGAMLKAASLKMTFIVDGFIMTACLLAAKQLYPEVQSYAVFGHQGDELGHKLILDYLGAKPILNLGLRLGEGTGAVCAYPIIESSIRMINEMDTFKEVKVSKYF
ncbi:nicotinate-nucleotide--dimethylbenzimidazole phosphoribosyltransferase [Balneicella halophila]|nr:nicotinate-nucleotide--dimethylbenzimidazole phosphoribosyltransferase [Balneicella halophila]